MASPTARNETIHPLAATSEPRRVLIVDEHPVLRRGLASLLDREADLTVCAEAATRKGALAAIRKHRPDLIMVDLALGAEDGLDVVKAITTSHSTIPILVFSMHDEAVYAERSLRAGARGYVAKQEPGETVLLSIRRVLGGATHMSARVQEQLAMRFVVGRTVEPDTPVARLSDRELQVFRLIGQGRTTRRIADALCISIKTVESHREHIKQKLAIATGAELAQRATQWVETGRIG